MDKIIDTCQNCGTMKLKDNVRLWGFITMEERCLYCQVEYLTKKLEGTIETNNLWDGS